MNNKSAAIAVIGGDKRQEYVVELLESRGYRVTTYGVKAAGMCKSLREAVSDANLILGPVPFTRDQKTLVWSGTKEGPTLLELMLLLSEKQILAGGLIPEPVVRSCNERQIGCFDFMKSETLTVFNSIATAEGAIAEAVLRHPSNLHGADILVIGYGRCGKTLAGKLRGLSAAVTVCARSQEERMHAVVQGCRAMDFEECYESLSRFEIIFNSVPALVLDEKALKKVSKDTLIIDIASAPGGVDFAASGILGIEAVLCSGLPGRYSPKSSAGAVVEEVLRHCINN